MATPMRVPQCSPFLKTIIEGIDQLLKSGKDVPYNAAMKLMNSHVRTSGLERAIQHPHTFSPLPKWLSRNQLFKANASAQVSKHTAKLSDAVAVNAYWLSGRLNAAVPLSERYSLGLVEPGSIWAEVLQQAMCAGGYTSSSLTLPTPGCDPRHGEETRHSPEAAMRNKLLVCLAVEIYILYYYCIVLWLIIMFVVVVVAANVDDV